MRICRPGAGASAAKHGGTTPTGARRACSASGFARLWVPDETWVTPVGGLARQAAGVTCRFVQVQCRTDPRIGLVPSPAAARRPASRVRLGGVDHLLDEVLHLHRAMPLVG